jgi:S-adenosylmethionine-diacylglycerol 3-amino-3-carboxypropyl transferase
MRSAGLDLDFVPQQFRDRLRFQPERTARLHQLDRVGTYGSTHFAEVIA